MIEVTKTIDWDMGHRVPNHASKCRNPHGHRYKLELTVGGPVLNEKGSSSEGMVIDFGDIKQVMMEHVHDALDHGFMVYEDDARMVQLLFNEFNDDIPVHGWNIIKVDFIPTAENIVQWIVTQLAPHLQGLKIMKARLFETPNSWADWIPEQITLAQTGI